jgi:hypothetical protein
MKAVEEDSPLESVDTFLPLDRKKESGQNGGGTLWEKFPSVVIDPGNDATLLQRVDRLDNLVSAVVRSMLLLVCVLVA